jgi:hypothetical protein
MKPRVIRDLTEVTGLVSPSEWSLLVALDTLGKPSPPQNIAGMASQLKLPSDFVAAILGGLKDRGFVSVENGLWRPSHPPLTRLLERQTENFLRQYVDGVEGGLAVLRSYLDQRER